MTPQQEVHVQKIEAQFAHQMRMKYAKGAKEHKGNLFDLPAIVLVQNAIDEAIDQFVYLVTLRDRLVKDAQANVGVF